MHIVDNIGLATNKYPIPIFMSVDCPFPSSLTNRLVNTSAMDINTIGTDVIILRNFSRYPMHDVSLHCTWPRDRLSLLSSSYPPIFIFDGGVFAVLVLRALAIRSRWKPRTVWVWEAVAMLYASVLLVSVVVRRRELLVCDNIMVNTTLRAYHTILAYYHSPALSCVVRPRVCPSNRLPFGHLSVSRTTFISKEVFAKSHCRRSSTTPQYWQ